MTAPSRFDLTAPLPVGRTTLIEASAGTGKTFTLTSLALRFVAEHDVPINQLLIVTFTNSAAAELRKRIRAVLVTAAEYLAAPGPTEDPVLRILGQGTSEQVDQRRQRLGRAIRDFDAATISTIHGFCAQARSAIGVLSGAGVDRAVVESEAAVIDEVCSDLIFSTARSLGQAVSTDSAGQTVLDDLAPSGDLMKVEDLVKIVKKSRTMGEVDIVADNPGDDMSLDERLKLARDAVSLVQTRLTRTGQMTYDLLVESVRDLIRDDHDFRLELRRKFRVALIDEFQDTDPLQWEIFRDLFGQESPGSTLVMVGDPKQAIYSFRGGDVYTYLEAKTLAETRVLSTNFRSTPTVVGAMNLLSRGHFYGDPNIAYQEIDSADVNSGKCVVDQVGESSPGIRVRCVIPESFTEDGARAKSEETRTRVAEDVADVAVDLIERFSLRRIDEGEVVDSSVQPSDIAVLAGSADECRRFAAQLVTRGIPAVLFSKENVARSTAANEWLTLLRALERPSDVGLASAVSLGWFVGWSATELFTATVDDEGSAALAELQGLLHDWAELLRTKGIAELVGDLKRRSGVVERILSRPSGERDITDLEHVAELVHSTARSRAARLTPSEAISIIVELSRDPEGEALADAVQRRVETDAEAVKVMTVHGAKGLEFPIVLLPDLWPGGNRVKAFKPYTYFDKARGRRVIDISDTSAGSDQAQVEACGDQHRLTYVAMTRASHLSVLWYARPKATSDRTGLARLLFADDPDIAPNQKVRVPKESWFESLTDRIQTLAADGSITVEAVPRATGQARPRDRASSQVSGEPLAVRTLGRKLDRSSSRWSFSSIKSNIRVADHDRAALDHERFDPTVDAADDRGVGDEIPDVDLFPPSIEVDPAAGGVTESDVDVQARSQQGWDSPANFDGLGAGNVFGSLVHELYETTDFAVGDPEAAFGESLDRLAVRYQVSDAQRHRLPRAMADTLATPLGAGFGGLRLADLKVSDRLNELDFYFPVAPSDAVSAALIGEVVRSHLEPGNELTSWAEGLSSGLRHIDLSGYLNGSIDLVLRYQLDGVTRFSVVDYKSNRLGSRDGSILGDYHPSRLTAAMIHHQYPLQAVIYAVVLHRYLRWRLRDYDPRLHLGPVGYLFVRGMVGPETPTASVGLGDARPAGLFQWDIPVAMIEDLSDLLAGCVPEGADAAERPIRTGGSAT